MDSIVVKMLLLFKFIFFHAIIKSEILKCLRTRKYILEHKM